MVDTIKLRKLVDHFASSSRPTNRNLLATATVGDVDKVVENLAKLLRNFVEELEKSE